MALEMLKASGEMPAKPDGRGAGDQVVEDGGGKEAGGGAGRTGAVKKEVGKDALLHLRRPREFSGQVGLVRLQASPE